MIKRWWDWWVRFWKGVWAVVKSMGSWKGVLSLRITWLAISGSGISLIGIILTNAWRTRGANYGMTEWNKDMLSGIGGTFTSDPTINRDYYVENQPV